MCHSEMLTLTNLTWVWQVLSQIGQVECVLPGSLLLSQSAWLFPGLTELRTSRQWMARKQGLGYTLLPGTGLLLC